MPVVVLGLGSNKSLCIKNKVLSSDNILNKACSELKKHIKELRCSSIYITKPLYMEEQSDFFNMVVLGDYSGSPRELLNLIHIIEAKYGRDRSLETFKGPRTLDIDIELFGDITVNDNSLSNPLFIPHPLMSERQFVLIPLLEILNNSAESIIDKQKYAQMLSKLQDQGVRLWKSSRKH
ncbi:MAG: 2-amino-4-hydroxy-6-hydroxymethyldihydropteridine diphosphokinase [Spirochaetaceae bacterium]|nr:2-amino-4-hydroxy-6-hydroxymethyldihydropteridine diphosphokinase [Spirochaetaceae bacterium]MBO7484518.1 2-amino-4-hydroxy-6-hydroxymethyldihydropteridine diphosphokinase [Spirochaetaceae bacterium]MBP5330107.1 2-amino-4-hydroxy-6-hydroxymethyldihydropteridine diphosphokinase [Spirochaetaceae bacterium]